MTTSAPPGAGGADNVTVDTGGSIKPAGTDGGVILLMDTDNTITNKGALQWTGATNPTAGMQGAGGLTGNIVNSGQIRVDEDYTPGDTEPSTGGDDPIGDGDLDGPFAQGSDRYGIRVTAGSGLFTGSVTNDTTGSIIVEGNDSYGIRLEADMTGGLMHRGAISVVGDDSYGIRTEGTLGQALEVRGSVVVQGENAVGVSVEDQVNGLFRIQGGVSAYGYRYTQASADQAEFGQLDADDLLQGGPAVQVLGNVTGGILVDSGRPVDDTTTTDDDTDTDRDDDGILDAEEGTGGSITVYGSAPAVQIGGTGAAVTVGTVGTGDNAYGFINKGAIAASGVYQDRSAVAVRIGSDSATLATVAGGIRNEGSLVATAVDDDATGLLVTNGGQVGVGGVGGVLVNSGSIGAQTTALSGSSAILVPHGTEAPGYEELNTARAIHVQAGGALSTVNNTGTITAVAVGENGSATAIQDDSGTLRTITNSFRIGAFIQPTDDALDTDDADLDPNNETITGTAIAIDLRNATQAITISQNGIDDGDDGADGVADADADADGVDDADEPSITGKIFLGSGADAINLHNGVLVGDVDFGDGANTFTIDGGALAQGRLLTGTTGGVSVNLADGRLIVTDTDTINGDSLTVGADGVLVVTLDAETETSTRFVVNTANIATGAQIGVISKGLLVFDDFGQDTESSVDFVVVDANDLTVGTIDQTLLGASPYIYDVESSTDTANDNLVLKVARRKAADIGFNASQAASYDAIYLALGGDEGLANAVLGQFDRAGFLELYNQLMPEQGEGLFSALDMAQISISRAIAAKPDRRDRYGPDSLWFQELNVQVKRDTGDTLGSETKAFGFVGGYEAMGDDGGALGATLAYVTAEEEDDAAKVGELTNVSQVEAGLYWRQAAGSWLFSVRGGAGYAWMDGTRRFIDADTAMIREATADWTGYTLSGHAGVQYEQRFGRFYARPGAYLDYFYFNEGERQETGGAGLDQRVAARTSSRFSGTAELALGAEYGRDFWWRPEVRVGYRQHIAGQIGDTVASFPGGSPFTLMASEPGDGSALVAIALKMGTPMSYLAVEGEMERADGEQRYNAKLSGRMMF